MLKSLMSRSLNSNLSTSLYWRLNWSLNSHWSWNSGCNYDWNWTCQGAPHTPVLQAPPPESRAESNPGNQQLRTRQQSFGFYSLSTSSLNQIGTAKSLVWPPADSSSYIGLATSVHPGNAGLEMIAHVLLCVVM